MCDGWYTERPKRKHLLHTEADFSIHRDVRKRKQMETKSDWWLSNSGQVAQPAPDYSLKAVRAKKQVDTRGGFCL